MRILGEAVANLGAKTKMESISRAILYWTAQIRATEHAMSISRTLYAGGMAALALTLAMPLATREAHARIVCRDGFQKVAGNMIATPYCQDDLLAKVARQHGMRASAARIRNNPNYKREVCRLVGNDIRVSEHCLREIPSIRGRGY